MIKGITHTAIRAKDMEATARFYTDVLGMKEAFRLYFGQGNECSGIYIYVAPNQFIEIFPDGMEKPEFNNQIIGHNHMCYEVDDAASVIEVLRSRGAVIDSELSRGFTKCIQFWTHDPDGNRIEFMELPKECMQVQATERFSIAHEEAE